MLWDSLRLYILRALCHSRNFSEGNCNSHNAKSVSQQCKSSLESKIASFNLIPFWSILKQYRDSLHFEIQCCIIWLEMSNIIISFKLPTTIANINMFLPDKTLLPLCKMYPTTLTRARKHSEIKNLLKKCLHL